MELNLGFVDNNNQLTVATLENNQIKTTDSISLSDEQKDVDTDNSPSNLFGIVYEGELPTVDLGDPLFISSKNNLPLSPCMSYEEIFTKVKEHTNHQSLREITKTLENIFILSDQFQSLYNQSRNQFFKEIWLIIRRSFLTQHLSIFYYNIDEKKGEKLSLQKIEGVNKCLFSPSDEDEMQMFDTIKPHISPTPTTLSYDFEKGELTLAAQVNGTSFLVLAKVFQFTLLQRTMFISLVNGINHQLGKKVSRKTTS